MSAPLLSGGRPVYGFEPKTISSQLGTERRPFLEDTLRVRRLPDRPCAGIDPVAVDAPPVRTDTAPVVVGALFAPEDSPPAVTALMGSAGVRCSSESAEASVPSEGEAESESHGSAWDEVWAPSRVERIPTGMAPVT